MKLPGQLADYGDSPPCTRPHVEDFCLAPGTHFVWKVEGGRMLHIVNIKTGEAVACEIDRIPWLVTVLAVKAKRGEVVAFPMEPQDGGGA